MLIMMGLLELNGGISVKKPIYKILYVQVLFAITVGVILGHFYPSTGAAMKPLGDGFIKLIKMIILALITKDILYPSDNTLKEIKLTKPCCEY